jgi:hypothetical protein
MAKKELEAAEAEDQADLGALTLGPHLSMISNQSTDSQWPSRLPTDTTASRFRPRVHVNLARDSSCVRAQSI